MEKKEKKEYVEPELEIEYFDDVIYTSVSVDPGDDNGESFDLDW